MRPMTPGLAALVVGYGLSQFYRAFLAVLAPTLEAELGAGSGDLALSSGFWFVAFGAVQLPIGWALDRIGPRFTTSGLLAFGGAGGAALFALAQAPWHLHVAMTLIGLGCAPILMAAYYLLARFWPAHRFSALAGIAVGAGSLGNILGTSPLVAAVEHFGWRGTLAALALVTLAVAVLIAVLVRDGPAPSAAQPRGSVAEILRIRGLWPIMPLIFVNYAAPAAVQGVWAAPFLATVYGADSALIGIGTLVMGVTMVTGNLAVGAVVRLTGGPRPAVIGVTLATVLAVALLAWRPDVGLVPAIACLGILGFSGMNYALLMADGRRFLPPHLVGRGITLLNTFSIAGVGILQFASRPVYHGAMEAAGPMTAIARVFLLILVPLVLGFLPYLLSREAPDAPR